MAVVIALAITAAITVANDSLSSHAVAEKLAIAITDGDDATSDAGHLRFVAKVISGGALEQADPLPAIDYIPALSSLHSTAIL